MAISGMQILTTLIVVFVGAIFVTAVFPDVFSSSTALMRDSINQIIPSSKDLVETQTEGLGNWTGGTPSCVFYNITSGNPAGSRGIGCYRVNTSSYMNFQFDSPSNWFNKTNISLNVRTSIPTVNISIEIRLQDNTGAIATFNITNMTTANATGYNTSWHGLNLSLSSFTGWSSLNQSAIENITFFPHFNFTSDDTKTGNYTFDGIYVYRSIEPAFLSASLSVLNIVIVLVVLALIILFVIGMMGGAKGI